MSEDLIRYDVLASEALRGIIRTVLQRVQRRGLPGEHHFYINFDTCSPGVLLSKRLKEQYPVEMTIVLQHKFWDLAVHDDRFEVRLSFNGVPERLVVPLASIKSFVDPSVPFGLNPNHFAGSPERHGVPSAPVPVEDAEVIPGPQSNERATTAVKPEASNSAGDDEGDEPKTAKVVELDLFRKK
jgi:hypothetical protein